MIDHEYVAINIDDPLSSKEHSISDENNSLCDATFPGISAIENGYQLTDRPFTSS